jgi:hypothetical protein
MLSGPEAGELMGTVQVAMMAALPYTTLRDAVFTHPTMTEGFTFLFENVVDGRARDAEKPEYTPTFA